MIQPVSWATGVAVCVMGSVPQVSHRSMTGSLSKGSISGW